MLAFEIQEDRLAQARRNVLLIEAEHASTGKRLHRSRVSRELMAKGLVALAEWIAPTVTMPRTDTGPLAR